MKVDSFGRVSFDDGSDHFPEPPIPVNMGNNNMCNNCQGPDGNNIGC